MVKVSLILRDLALATVLAAAFAVLFSSVVHSAERGALRQACASDVHTLCAGVFPGGGRIKQCMIEKFAQLSGGCKSALADARALSKNK